MKPMLAPSVRIIIVDETPEDYNAVLAAAGTPGVSFHFLLSGNDALRFAKRYPSGLWVIHTQLPDVSGFDFAQMLRSMRPSALVFMIGDEYRLDDEMQTLSLGLAKYLCKPLEPAWILPDSQDFCIPLPACRAPSPALRVIGEGSQHLPETVSWEEAFAEASEDQYILPFNPDFRRRPAA